jgi:hypothetical protein
MGGSRYQLTERLISREFAHYFIIVDTKILASEEILWQTFLLVIIHPVKAA